MSEVAGLKGGEEVACCARLRFHRGRGDEPSWAPGAWCWRLRMVSTILSALVVTAHSYVGGRIVFVRWDAFVTCIFSLIQNRENPCHPRLDLVGWPPHPTGRCPSPQAGHPGRAARRSTATPRPSPPRNPKHARWRRWRRWRNRSVRVQSARARRRVQGKGRTFAERTVKFEA